MKPHHMPGGLTKETRWQYIMGCMEAHKLRKEQLEKKVVEVLSPEAEPKRMTLKEVYNG
jgi:hypothetical protein